MKNKWWGPVWRGLTSDPHSKHYLKLKNAIWLLLYFITDADRKTGYLIRKCQTISQDMGVSKNTIYSWLARLRKHDYIETQSTGRALLIKIAKWRPIKKMRKLSPHTNQSNATIQTRVVSPDKNKAKAMPRKQGQLAKNQRSGYTPNERVLTKDINERYIARGANNSFSNETYTKIIRAYKRLKRVRVDRTNKGKILRNIKTMLQEKYKPKDIIACMEFMAQDKFYKPIWDMGTVCKKIAEFAGGRLKRLKKRRPFYRGCPMRYDLSAVFEDGQWKQFVGKEEDIEWKEK
ncbi:helix-turn-helix domain-containing protein [candidate division WOR-3 bacterium]|nr:helix-turn-helix domain-containing protein [candidate division WOR-3 bacterium]